MPPHFFFLRRVVSRKPKGIKRRDMCEEKTLHIRFVLESSPELAAHPTQYRYPTPIPLQEFLSRNHPAVPGATFRAFEDLSREKIREWQWTDVESMIAEEGGLPLSLVQVAKRIFDTQGDDISLLPKWCRGDVHAVSFASPRSFFLSRPISNRPASPPPFPEVDPPDRIAHARQFSSLPERSRS